jgi:hypothetical protein
MDAKLRSLCIFLLSALTAVTGIALVGTEARADLLVSSFPDTTLSGQQKNKPQCRVSFGCEPFGNPEVRPQQGARQDKKPNRSVSHLILRSFLNHVGAAGLVMTFVPLDGPPPPSGSPPPVTSSSGGPPTHVSSAPEPGTLLAGLVGAGLVGGLVLFGNRRKKAALAVRA